MHSKEFFGSLHEIVILCSRRPDAELLGLEGLPQKCYPAPISHQDMAGIIKLCASSCPNMTTICLERLTGHRHGPCPGQKEIYRAMLPSSILLYCKTCDKRDSKENPF
ncbi:hypothetical protein FOCC_FOCC001914 [Frankliniella occidentalis]|nr:hypothetical protein FOCC_FOCC001914 [Frankliniella occidentalis]